MPTSPPSFEEAALPRLGKEDKGGVIDLDDPDQDPEGLWDTTTDEVKVERYDYAGDELKAERTDNAINTRQSPIIDLDDPNDEWNEPPPPKTPREKTRAPQNPDGVSPPTNGHARLQLREGTVYEGQLMNGVICGRGMMRWRDGAVYEGEFALGLRNGHGIFKAGGALAGMVYEGDFDNDKMEGVGRCTFADGRQYSGQWREGHIEGTGSMHWQNGSEYTGEYVRDKKHGHGTFKWPDGRSHSGEWKDGKQDGQGVATDAQGNATPGTWRQGRLLVQRHSDKASQGSSDKGSRSSAALSDQTVLTPPNNGKGFGRGIGAKAKSLVTKAPPAKAKVPYPDVKHIYWDFRDVDDLPA
jgi:hypothetical protein